jgi:hypothetical protein
LVTLLVHHREGGKMGSGKGLAPRYRGVIVLGILVLAGATLLTLALLGASHTGATISLGNGMIMSDFSEKQGKTGLGGNTFAEDTAFYAVNAGGLGGLPSSGSSTVDIYLFGDNGLPLKSNTATNVCLPCSLTVGAGKKSTVLVENKIIAAGGFPQPTVRGYAVIRVSGGGVSDTDVSAFELYRLSNGDHTREALPVTAVPGP